MVKVIIFYDLIIIPWMNLIQTSITPHKKELTKSIHEIIHHDCVLIIRTSIMSEKNFYFDSQAAHIFNVVNRKKKKTTGKLYINQFHGHIHREHITHVPWSHGGHYGIRMPLFISKRCQIGYLTNANLLIDEDQTEDDLGQIKDTCSAKKLQRFSTRAPICTVLHTVFT